MHKKSKGEGLTSRILATVLTPLSLLNAMLGVWARNAAAALMFVMTLIILLQVFFRYVLGNSLSWTEELAKILMVWSAFLVAPWAYRMGANVSIQLFTDAFSRRVRLLLQLVANCLVIWILARFLREGIDFWLQGFSVVSTSMPIRMGWFYTVVPFSLLSLIVVGIELAVRNLLSLIDSTADYDVPNAGTVQEEG